VREDALVDRLGEQQVRESDDEGEIEQRAQRELAVAGSRARRITRNSRVICRRQRASSALDLYHPARSLYPDIGAG
jgi:hypothetical protein